MAPFVPDIISDQLNLLVALFLGIGFGFVLEQAGFSSSRRLAGLFYGYDFTVLRVFFTAAITAMIGVVGLGYLGLLDTDAIFVNPTWLMPTIVGGVIMGVGFIIGGYCPGTSVVAAAIGKIDAMFFVLGGMLGVLGFGEAYPLVKSFNDSTSMGALKVYESLGMSQGLFVFALVAVAVAAFAVTTQIERRVSPANAPSNAFHPYKHAAAGALLLALAVVVLVLPDRRTKIIERVSSPGYVSSHAMASMEADELAFRIVDREPNIRIIDTRPADAYAKAPLPGSVNVQVHDLFGKEWISPWSQRHVKKVVVGESEETERTAAYVLAELGYENIALLRGGMGEFDRTILHPTVFVPAGNRWDGTVKEFREKAGREILKMIELAKSGPAKAVKAEKKVKGGC
jgi:rhodanese-related sulfurtransferase